MKLEEKTNFILGLFFLIFSFYSLATPSFLNQEKSQPFFQKTKLSLSQKIKSDLAKKKLVSSKKIPVIDNNYLDYQSSLAYLKAETAFLEKDTQLAIKYLKTAQVFSRDPAYLIERKADFYKQEGFCGEAINSYQNGMKKHGKQTRIQKKIMECYVINGLNHLALKVNESLLKQEPENFLLWFQKSILLISEKKWSLALDTFNHLLSWELSLDQKAQTLAFQSYVFQLSGKKEEALKSYNQLLALDFPQEAIVLQIAELFRKNGKEDWAFSYVNQFQKKEAITKYNTEFLFELAFVSGAFEEAFKQTEHLEALGKLKKVHRFYRAFYLGELEKHDQSLPYLKDLLLEDSKNGQYQYMLALSYAKNRDIKKALLAYEKVSPRSSYFLVSRLELAKLLEKEGEHKKALSLLKDLAFGETVRPLAVSEYAKSLWNLGQKEEALLILTSALKQVPSHPELLNLKLSYSEKLKLAEAVL